MNNDSAIGSFEPDDIRLLDRAFRGALAQAPDTGGRAFDLRRRVASAVISRAREGVADADELERAGSCAAAHEAGPV